MKSSWILLHIRSHFFDCLCKVLSGIKIKFAQGIGAAYNKLFRLVFSTVMKTGNPFQALL